MANEMQKMREAVVAALQVLEESVCAGLLQGDSVFNAIKQLETAISTPLRNCDVGTAEEQERRWRVNCGNGIPNCKHCKVYEQAKNSGLVNGRYFMRCDCRFIWAQMPYEAKEEGDGR